LKQEVKQSEQLLLEEGLIKKAQANPSAFQELYEQYYKAIFLFVLHRIGQKETTADVVSQVFLKALLNIGRFKFKGLPFSAWLYRIAVNECNDFFRRTKRERLVVLEDSSVNVLYDEMFGEEVMEDLKRRLPLILERLTPDELEIIELRFLESRPFKEVAEILNITENYAKVRTYRILDKMKSIFIKSGI
jgi:RNA polymerase sigma-70 factor (ECF subfamily)